jgi:hypothetical protein
MTSAIRSEWCVVYIKRPYNAAMRSRLARIAILDTVCLFGLTGAIHSQQTRSYHDAVLP